MFDLLEIFNRILLEDITNKTDEIIRALRDHNLCTFTIYNSQVPGYGSVPEQRYGVILAYGVGRYKDEPCIRIFQTNKQASWGTPRGYGSDYKIFYLKDVLDIKVHSQKITSPPPKFNPDTDKWMKETIEVAHWEGYSKPQPVPKTSKSSDVYKTDTEKELEKRRETPPTMKIDVSGQSKTQTERYKQIQTLNNQALAAYKKIQKNGTPEQIEQAREKYRQIQNMANKYLSGYRKEKTAANQFKTDTEQELSN